MARKADMNDPDFLHVLIAILIRKYGTTELTNTDLAEVADYFLRTQADPASETLTLSIKTRAEVTALVESGESSLLEVPSAEDGEIDAVDPFGKMDKRLMN